MKTINTSVAVCLYTHRKNVWVQAKEFSLLNESLGDPLSLLTLQRVRSHKTWLTEDFIQDLKFKKDLFSAQLITINHPLHARDQGRLEKALCCKVMDRTELLLQIFEKRASSATGKLQVALAKIDYELSKLVRFWTHLERQRGGIGLRGGPGEKQIEIDRRLLRKKRDGLLKKLATSQKTRLLHMKARGKSNHPSIALVGYTNAGKSTLFKKMTGCDTFAEDLLFATLDPLSRKMKHERCRNMVLTDTVGFISEMPKVLEQTFHDTLVELRYADLILHVLDGVDEEVAEKRRLVESALNNMDIDTSCVWVVYNKIDQATSVPRSVPDCSLPTFAVSAVTGEGVSALFDAIYEYMCMDKEGLKGRGYAS